MFAEESIYGKSMVHIIDKEKRIILPKFTYVEQNDKLLIVDKQDYLAIYREDTYEMQFKKLEEEYAKCFDSNIKKQIELELLRLYSDVLKKVKSDKQHRISLSGIDLEKDEFLCIGAKDHVVLKTKCINKK